MVTPLEQMQLYNVYKGVNVYRDKKAGFFEAQIDNNFMLRSDFIRMVMAIDKVLTRKGQVAAAQKQEPREAK